MGPMLWALACALLLQGDDRGLDRVGYAEIQSPAAMIEVGPWRAWLESPGGELPFELVITRDGGKFAADFQNGQESINEPETRIDGDQIVIEIPRYDSRITATIAPLGTRLDGEWKKRSGLDKWTSLPFHAQAGAAPRFARLGGAAERINDGRFSVKFEQSGVAVLMLNTEAGATVGTFLTTTGDFRFLCGSLENHRLRLSCFDGAHAFLFDAISDTHGALHGDFWSGDKWHEKWEAKPDPNASLPDGFDQAHWKDGFGLAQLLYPDLNGVEHSLGEGAFAGKAIVIQVLGSWCPNCHDEMPYLAKVYDRYKDRGLSVVGLAFEVTGDWTRDAQQVRRMRERYGAKYPVLLAGSSEKQKATEAFPALDRVFAFPTTIFLHRDGRVRAVHSGFAGPATKEEHEKLAKRFEGIIEELLAEPDGDDGKVWSVLTASPWRDSTGKQFGRFLVNSDGSRQFTSADLNDNGRSNPETLHSLSVRGTTVVLDSQVWSFDPRSGELIDPRDFRNQLYQGPRLRLHAVHSFDAARLLSEPDLLIRIETVFGAGAVGQIDAGPALIECTKHGFAPLRREAATAIGELAYEPGAGALRSLQADLDPLVREAAARALQKLEKR